MSLLNFYPPIDLAPEAKPRVALVWRSALLKWIVPTVIGIIVSTDLVVKNVHAETTAATTNPAPAEKVIAPTAVLTTFIDGPTGFVFVYTTEGWKFVRKDSTN